MLNKKRSKKCMKKYEARQKLAKVEDHLLEQFTAGRLLGKGTIIDSRSHNSYGRLMR